MFYNCFFSVFIPWSSVTSISITLFPTLQCLLCSELLPNQSSSVPSKKSGMQHSPLATSSGCIHSCAVSIQWQWACSGLLCFPCGVSVCSPAKSPAEHRPFTRSLEGLVHSLLHQAPPAALTSFLTPYDHSFCPPQLLWDASGMCLTSLPPLQQHVWAPVPREAQPGFLLSLQTSVPWFCHLWVIPVASCSFGILLSFTGPGLYRLLTGTIAIFFSSQRYGAGFCTHFHQIHIWCNGWALRLSWPGSCDLSGMWSHITGMQRVSWWSLKGIVGKGKFSALGKNHWCLICRWNSSCFWVLPMRCFVPGLHLELGG